jgi:hypothetical protein
MQSWSIGGYRYGIQDHVHNESYEDLEGFLCVLCGHIILPSSRFSVCPRQPPCCKRVADFAVGSLSPGCAKEGFFKSEGLNVEILNIRGELAAKITYVG